MTTPHEWLGRLCAMLGQDVRYAFRTFRKSPAFSVVAALTLALGVGASTSLFSVVHGVLLKPLPYHDADRLALVIAEQDFEGAHQPARMRFPPAAVAAWPSEGTTVERVAFFSEQGATIAGVYGAELIDVAVVSASFFDTISGDLVLGRGLRPSDDLQPVAVISQRLRRRLYGSAPDVLEQRVVLGGGFGAREKLRGQAFTVVGVASDTFQLPGRQTDMWIPAGFARTRNAGCCEFTTIARMTSEASLAAATQEIRAIVHNMAVDMPDALGGVRVRVVTLRDVIVGETRPALLVLAAAVGLLLFLACANVMNLLLARATARAHETGIRRALGASRSRLVAQALVESALLAVAGGVVGVVLAAVSIRALKAWPVTGLPRLEAVQMDGAVLLFALAVAAASTVAVGLLPALQSGEVSATLEARERGMVSSRKARVALRAVSVVQLAVSVVLLVGAVLLGRSLIALMRTDLGVTPEQVATASLNLAMDRTLTDQQQIELIDRVVERVRSLPEVIAAGVGTARPPDSSRLRLTLNRTNDPSARGTYYQAAGVAASPGYFRALNVRLERGRLFTEADSRQARPVVIMSSDTARRLFGAEEPLGQTIGLPVLRDGTTGNEEMTVVGITANVKYSGLDQLADDVVYRPFAQQAWRSVFLVARTSGDPAVLASQLRSEIATVDPAITVSDVMPLETILSEATAQPRFRTLLLGAFALMAIAIAGVGLYGVIAYSLSRRTAEIGVRMALGADSRRIRIMVLREGLALALVGSVLGLIAAYGLTRLLAALLYGIAPTDPTSFALAMAGVATIGLVASYVPADRATRVDPLVVLKAE
jgi:putative ABC transport system permease protein